jgi:hypothetical protein
MPKGYTEHYSDGAEVVLVYWIQTGERTGVPNCVGLALCACRKYGSHFGTPVYASDHPTCKATPPILPPDWVAEFPSND